MKKQQIAIIYQLIFTGCSLNSQSESQSLPMKDIESFLPDANGSNSYGPPIESPTFSVWFSSLDALVIGEISNIKLVTNPSISPVTTNEGWTWEDLENCPGTIVPSIEITLSNAFGIETNIPNVISFKIGSDQVNMYQPYPRRQNADGTIIWNTQPEPDKQFFAIGSKIAAPLHFINEYNCWSLMGELLLAVNNDIITVQKVSNTWWYPLPNDMNDKKVSDLIDLAKSTVISQESISRKIAITQSWGPENPPTKFSYPRCIIINNNHGENDDGEN